MMLGMGAKSVKVRVMLEMGALAVPARSLKVPPVLRWMMTPRRSMRVAPWVLVVGVAQVSETWPAAAKAVRPMGLLGATESAESVMFCPVAGDEIAPRALWSAQVRKLELPS